MFERMLNVMSDVRSNDTHELFGCYVGIAILIDEI
jgi:hypothetical protein